MNLSFTELKTAAKILRNRRIVANVDKFEKKESYFNCWNFTAFTLGWTKELSWFSCYTMDKLLEEKSYRIPKDKIRAGDIVVYRSYGLEHTALILDPEKKTIIHKDGCFPIELNKYNNVYRGCRITFQRPKKGNKR